MIILLHRKDRRTVNPTIFHSLNGQDSLNESCKNLSTKSEERKIPTPEVASFSNLALRLEAVPFDVTTGVSFLGCASRSFSSYPTALLSCRSVCKPCLPPNPKQRSSETKTYFHFLVLTGVVIRVANFYKLWIKSDVRCSRTFRSHE